MPKRLGHDPHVYFLFQYELEDFSVKFFIDGVAYLGANSPVNKPMGEFVRFAFDSL